MVDHERGVANVPRGFRGPPTSVHGGAMAGMVACLGDAHLAGPTSRFSVRLHAPPPLETDLPYTVVLEPGRHRLRFELAGPDGPVVTGWAATADSPPREGDRYPVVPEPTVADLAAHATLSDAERHTWASHHDPEKTEFSECFGCGTANPDGLHLRTRAIDDHRAWIDWRPDARWLDGDQLALLPAIAALDCTSAIPLRQLGLTLEEELSLLGTYDAEIHRRPAAEPAAGDSYRIVTAPRERDGRKIWADIGLFGADGEVFITGCATWIMVPAVT